MLRLARSPAYLARRLARPAPAPRLSLPRHTPRPYSTQETRDQTPLGPSWRAGALFVATGLGLVWYFRNEKAKQIERKEQELAKASYGKARIGGSFSLVTHDNLPFTQDDLVGAWNLIYFGFTHCPDICPEELDKMSQMIDLVAASQPKTMRPVFITCDPARDTPAVVKSYLSEFHPALIGLTGTWEQVKAVCKAYRVYFSTPPNVKPGEDYLVDHSIYFYLMDPEGDFVEAIGRQHSPERAASIILEHIKDWKGKMDRG